MTEQQTTYGIPATPVQGWGTFPPQAPQKAPKDPKKPLLKKPAVWVGIALLVGLGLGSTKPTPAPVNVPGPERTVEVPVEKIVEKTPAACLTAMTLSEEGFTYAGEIIGHMSDALQAASRLDVAGIEAASAKMKIVNPKLSALAPQMNAAKAECRAAK